MNTRAIARSLERARDWGTLPRAGAVLRVPPGLRLVFRFLGPEPSHAMLVEVRVYPGGGRAFDAQEDEGYFRKAASWIQRRMTPRPATAPPPPPRAEDPYRTPAPMPQRPAPPPPPPPPRPQPPAEPGGPTGDFSHWIDRHGLDDLEW